MVKTLGEISFTALHGGRFSYFIRSNYLHLYINLCLRLESFGLGGASIAIASPVGLTICIA